MRVQAGATGSFKRTDMTDITNELAELYQPVCEEKRLAFNYSPREDLFVLAAETAIGQDPIGCVSTVRKLVEEFRAMQSTKGSTLLAFGDQLPSTAGSLLVACDRAPDVDAVLAGTPATVAN